MRLKITLQPERPDTAVPINYQYPLSAVVYRILHSADAAYAEFLHDEGYPSSNNRKLKLFVFSPLYSSKKARVENGTLRWFGKPDIWFFLGSPLEETFIQNFILGIFQQSSFSVGISSTVVRFMVTSVEALPAPEWKEKLRCRSMGPMVVSIRDDNHKQPVYLPPDSPQFAEGVRMNLLRKHEALHGPFTEPLDMKLTPDASYLERRGGAQGTSKLITIKEGRAEESKVRGFVFPFTLELSPPLLETAWDCGLGEKNSLGFGMWGVG